ncbi:unnamed protein product [Aphanomyces euteiches]|uniref:BHLH domain-containing protein n=1 Tax=Aphanomyces euteiches TaxID=100861 RepID=A0A6G0XLK5_9STRA|nr:hypothetical protein Ae201684_003443 [Aphanomyces euteiches]KAG9409478.1 hypothetical protein AC1031_019738 [Aphanomyces cochlioides]KAH9098488.1 hypothetical protein Ae201684P_017700 [Aphanomyces euteiches]KAH9145937.1 hypothetical protein AeRB84_010166 [Aphanomyces euteiches]
MWVGQNDDDAAASTGKSTSSNRAELNLKEKQRMLKLNATIDNLRKELDNAGVSSKMNKQSILDNTIYYITNLQNDVVIAKQKAEYAQRIAPPSAATISPFERYFEMSSTPKLIITLDIQLVRANHAFRVMSGYTEDALRHKETLLACLSVDTSRVRNMVLNAIDSKKPVQTVVENAFATARLMNCLVFTAIFDAEGTTPECIEVVVTPLHRATV